MPNLDNNSNLPTSQKKWYQKKWPIILIVVSFITIIFLVYFSFLVYNEYQLIKNKNSVPIDIKSFLEKQAKFAQTDPRLDYGDDPYLGNLNAKVKIIEFGDFECPYCRESFVIIRTLAEIYNNQILIVFKDFPLTDIHTHASQAAWAANCALKQDKFWPYHDKLFINQENLEAVDLINYASQLNLNMNQFESCLTSQQISKEIEADVSDGTSLGIKGTPTFFINGVRIAGTIPENIFKEIINYLLNNQNNY